MNTLRINCFECKSLIEYWTKRNFIHCPNCKTKIDVVPCEEMVEIEEMVEEGEAFDEGTKT